MGIAWNLGGKNPYNHGGTRALLVPLMAIFSGDLQSNDCIDPSFVGWRVGISVCRLLLFPLHLIIRVPRVASFPDTSLVMLDSQHHPKSQ